MPNVVTRRIVLTQMLHELDGTVKSIHSRVVYEQENDANPSIQLSDERWIIAKGDDLTNGDKTSLTAMASRVADIIERVEPLEEV